MIYSVATSYALRALAALPADGSYLQAKELAGKLDIPGPYLSKVLKILARNGLLCSVRGPGGGYCLARPAQQISVYDVIQLTQGPGILSSCIMGLPACPWRSRACALVPLWDEMRGRLQERMAAVTIHDLHLDRRLADAPRRPGALAPSACMGLQPGRAGAAWDSQSVQGL